MKVMVKQSVMDTSKNDYIFQMDSDDQFYTDDIKQFLKEDFSENLIIGRIKENKNHLIRLKLQIL